MDQIYMANHIICTSDEKMSCLETVRKLLALAQKARCMGLLELERMIDTEEYQKPQMFRIAFSLIVDGTDPVIVKEVIENYIVSSALSNRDFLENSLILVGALAIQQGENQMCIWEKLCSLFGLSFRETFHEYFFCRENSIDTEQLLTKYKEKLEALPKTSILNSLPDIADRRSIQRIIREVSQIDLEIAMIGSQEKVLMEFFCNLSTRRQQMFCSYLDAVSEIRIEVIESSQKKVLDILKSLEYNGEILAMGWQGGRLTQEELNQILERVK